MFSEITPFEGVLQTLTTKYIVYILIYKVTLFAFREVSGINSQLGAKQNCASPSAADTHNVPKSFERVGVHLSSCVVSIFVVITQESLFCQYREGRKGALRFRETTLQAFP